MTASAAEGCFCSSCEFFRSLLGHQTTLGYNGIGLLTSVTDALQHTTRFGYDFADLTSVTDPLSNTTSMFRDSALYGASP
jgi:YD repeat-containing protein